jgi:integrase
MKTRPTPASAGLLISEDGFGVHSVRLASTVAARIRRISALAQTILCSEPSTPGVEVAALTVFDAVRPSALPQVVSGLGHIFSWRGLTCLEWRAEEPPRLERRALHLQTCVLLQSKGLLCREVNADLHDRLCQFLDQQVQYAEFKRVDRVLEFERDLMCWWYQCLPMPLFFHLTGVQPLSAVTRACLACADTCLVPERASLAITQDASDSVDDDSCAELLDMVPLAAGQDSSDVVLKRALDILSMTGAEGDAVAKRRWISGLLGLRMVAAGAGPMTSLLVAWAVDLIESGTARQPNLPKITPYTYLHRTILPLFEALREMDGPPDSWSAEVLVSTYQVLVAAQSAGNKGTMASALTSFHRFLQEWYDVPPIRRPLHLDVPLPEARAIVIWPHQLALAKEWVSRVTDDPLLTECLQVLLAIAGEAPSRTKEILFLRLANVIDHGHCLEIEIAPSWRIDRLKTQSSQRRLYIRVPASMAIIRNRVAKVAALRAGPKTLLFADPTDRTVVYRRAHLSRAASRLLKAASGDLQAVVHSLRHSVLSLAIDQPLCTSSISGIDRFRSAAVDAGHATGTTTFLSYTHLYEAPLRQWLDAALLRLVPLKSWQAARLCGIGEAAFRQRACRLKTDTAAYGWALMRESGGSFVVPHAEAAFKWVEARPPQPVSRRDVAFGPAVTLLLISRLVEGSPPEEVANGFLMEHADIRRLHQSALNVVNAAASCIWPRRVAAAPVAPIRLREATDEIGLRLDQADHRKLAALHEWLQAERPLHLFEAAVKSWLRCRKGLYLGLDEPRAVAGLYRLLAEAGIDPALLRIGFRGAAFEQSNSTLRTTVERDFVTAFGLLPRTFPAAPRERVPQAYLQFDARDTMEGQHGRAGSLAGLDILMVAIAAHVNWLKAPVQ